MFRALRKWRMEGLDFPMPPAIKRAVILRHVKDIAATNFVETGTYLGDTPWFLRRHVSQIHSIEVQRTLASIARLRFAKYANIFIHNGDSGFVLAEVCRGLSGNTLFWLDGHYSGGVTGQGAKQCPIWQELEQIFHYIKTGAQNAHTRILIDDLRLFGQAADYPNKEELVSYAANAFPACKIAEEMDILSISLRGR